MKATVTLVCATDPNHIKELTAVVTAEQSGGCEDGKVTYTAVATFNKGEFTDSFVEELEAKAHTPDTKLFNEDPEKHYYICTACGAQVDAADHKWNNGTTVTAELLIELGMVKYFEDNRGLKVLGNGTLEKKLTVQAAKFTESAKEAIEKAGGKAEVL